MIEDIKTRKNIKIGKRYEHYIAWLLKRDGWDVYSRSKYGKYDRGVDIIATKSDAKRYIQCKGWSYRHSRIHEDVVSQLFGSVASLEGIDALKTAEMYIYSSTVPTPYAKEKADKLNIHFVHSSFPLWKRKKKLVQ